MTRVAYVARTAHDQKHLNRLRDPQFSIVSLVLVSGSRSSKSYLPADAPAPKTSASGSDQFHFVPEKETIQIAYELDDPFQMITTLKLELFRYFSEPALWTLDLAKLGPDALIDSKHVMKFDGRVTKGATAVQPGKDSSAGMEQDLTALPADASLCPDFPDGYISIEHSPYKLRLTATDGKTPATTATAWTYFHILLKSIELELGPSEAIPTSGLLAPRKARDAATYQALVANGGLPATGASKPRKIFLVSNIFKTTTTDMNDNTGYTEYSSAWDEGPRIPLTAKIRLLGSDGSEVKLENGPGAKALGKAKFLWDWEDPDPTGTQADAHQSQAA